MSKTVLTIDMEQHFEQLSAGLLAELKPGENLAISLAGERSHFCRINGANIRQTGLVDESTMTLDLIFDNRQASASFTLQGVLQQDQLEAHSELKRLREELAQLPQDLFIVLPSAHNTSRSVQRAALLPAVDTAPSLLPGMQGVDLTGIWSSGQIFRGNVNSSGSKHWFSTDSFSLDYSLVNAQEKMLKNTFAGADWDQQKYSASLQESIQNLNMMDKPAISIKPGNYRCYIAPAGVADLLGMFSWHGLSESAMQTGESAFARMRHEGIKLSPLFSLAEDFSSGLVPRFNDQGEVSAQQIELISGGELINCLCSSRTAKEFNLETNFAEAGEGIRLPVMQSGDLNQPDILAALGTGVYLSNLHYLNWSDVTGGRITGLTRYACFWVEDGVIQGPLETMRFDDSLYHFFGDQLEAVTSESSIIADVGTYDGRELGVTQCPGILLKSFALTL